MESRNTGTNNQGYSPAALASDKPYGAGASASGVINNGTNSSSYVNVAGGAQTSVGGSALPPSPYLSQGLPTSAKVTLPPPMPTSALPYEPASDPRAHDPRLSNSPAATIIHSASSSPHPAAPAPAAAAPVAPVAAPSASIDTILVRGLPREVTVEKLANYFGEFGQLKMDRTKDPPAPHITIIPNAMGADARLVWDTAEHAPLAVEYFNGKHWPGGGSIAVSLALPPPIAQAVPPQSYSQPSYPPQNAYPPPYPQGPPPPSSVPHSYPPAPNNGYQQAPPAHMPPSGYGAPPAGQYGAPPSAPYDPYYQAGSAPNPPAPGAYDPYAYNPQSAPPPNFAPGPGYAPGPGAYPPPPHGGYNPNGPPTGPYNNYGPPNQGYNQGHPPNQNYGGYGGHGGHGGHGGGRGREQVGGYPGFHFKGKGGAARAGDWICPACSNINFTYRTTCKQCSLARPASAVVVERDEEGAQPRRNHRDPSTHPDAAHDWHCKCGFKNFSKREQCYECGSLKPFGQPSHGPVRYSGGGLDRTRPY